MTLRTGLLLLPSRPARELRDLAVLAEALGYDYFWLADERFFREVYALLALAATRTTPYASDPASPTPFRVIPR